MTVVLLIAAAWLALGTGVLVAWNIVKHQYARRGELGAPPPAARPVDEPARATVRIVGHAAEYPSPHRWTPSGLAVGRSFTISDDRQS